MMISGQRTMWRWLVALGIALCLSPTVAGFYVFWKRLMVPMLTMGPEKFNRVVNQQELQNSFQRDPAMLVTLFVLAPLGVTLLIVGLRRLRQLRRPPSLPPNYGMPGGIR